MGKIIKTTEATDIYNKKDYYQYYYLLINNYKLPLKDLLKKISKEVGHEISLSNLKSFIGICEEASVKKGKEMRYALNYSIAMQKGDLDTIRECKEVLDKIEEHKKIKRQAIKVNTNQKTRPNDRTHEEFIVDIIKDMNTVIRKKRPAYELKKEGLIINPNLTTEIKNNINELDLRKYLDYVFINSNLNEMTEKELLELKETLEFFISNLRKSYEYFGLLNYLDEEDAKKVRDFYVCDETELDNLTKETIGRLYNWKLKRIRTEFIILSNILKMVDGLLDNNFETLCCLSNHHSKFLKEDLPYIYEYYSNFMNIKSSYNSINRMDKLDGDKKSDLIKDYSKRLIIR